MWTTTLVLLLLGCGWWVSGEPSRQPASNSPSADPAHSTCADWWLQVLPEINRKVAQERKKVSHTHRNSEQWSPFHVTGGVGGQAVLVLPIPVSKKQSSQIEYDAHSFEDEDLEIDKSPRERPGGGPRLHAYVIARPSGRGSLDSQRPTEDEKIDVDETPLERPYEGPWRPPNVAWRSSLQPSLIPQQSSKGWSSNKPPRRPSKNNYEDARQTHLDFDRPPIDDHYDDDYLNSVRLPSSPHRQRPRPRPRLPPTREPTYIPPLAKVTPIGSRFPPTREEHDTDEYESPPLPKVTPIGSRLPPTREEHDTDEYKSPPLPKVTPIGPRLPPTREENDTYEYVPRPLPKVILVGPRLPPTLEEHDTYEYVPRPLSKVTTTGPRLPPTLEEHDTYEYVPRPLPKVTTTGPRRPPTHEEHDTYEYESPPLPKMTPIVDGVSSQILVDAFREQQPSAPHLPPLLLPAYGDGERGPLRPVLGDTDDAEFDPDNLYAPSDHDSNQNYPSIPPEEDVSTDSSGYPPRPRFDRSLQLHGELTVHRADYTEPYTAWWDAESGSARVEYHNGSTTSYRMVRDASVQRVEMHLYRVEPREIWRCGVASPRRATPTDRAPPAIPDLELFSFGGFSEHEGARVERWRRVVSGSAGELGAAQGEALTFHHEMLIRRKADGSTIPLRYFVSVDSSVLGANCDSYEHRYLSLRPHRADVDFFSVDVESSCDEVEELDSGAREHFARLDPLYEFTQPQRDTRYDAAFERFKDNHKRQYADNVEEAVRKNLLMQITRFVASANRQGAPSLHEVNFLADRLQAELRQLFGAVVDVDRSPSDPFPYEGDTLRDVVQQIPRRFDWRDEGGVTHVRNQQDCLSCWAFAVAGAVEGALFARTRQLVPLSEQCLVDCGHEYGCHGCGGTWPNFAFDYVKDRGLPALDEYTSYQAKVLRCKDKSVQPVTRITTHVNVTRNNPRALKVAIRHHGPTIVIVDGKPNSFTTYMKGVLYDDRCSKYNVNHALLAVGYGMHRLNRDKRLQSSVYFVLKNSWSTAWGDRGYIRLVGNTCGVLSKPSYPIIEETDIKYVPSTSAAQPSPSEAPVSGDSAGDAKPRRMRVRARVRSRVRPRRSQHHEPIDN